MRKLEMRVAITQPYVPQYRYKLWELVIANLAKEGIEARVFFGGDAEEHAQRSARGDAVFASWATEVPTRTWRISRRLPKVLDRRLPREWRNALLVTEMQATNINAWRSLISRRPYITFGHGNSGTTSNAYLSGFLKACLNRGAKHVITYAKEGRDMVVASGRVSPEKVTAFGNATDTTSLRHAYRSIGDPEVREFNHRHGIDANAKIALFLGALHESKRIDLLCQATLEVLRQDPAWWLVVAGDGPDSTAVEELSRTTGRVVMLGHASIHGYGPAARQASLIVNPGRVGLVAVDAMVLNLPVLTSPGSQLAPEAEYLEEGTTLITSSEATPQAFAEAWAGVDRLDRGSLTRSDYIPSIEQAAERVASAIIRGNKEIH